jgi:hypothetical protein
MREHRQAGYCGLLAEGRTHDRRRSQGVLDSVINPIRVRPLRCAAAMTSARALIGRAFIGVQMQLRLGLTARRFL